MRTLPHKNSKGIALLIALFSMMIMIVIATEVTERSTVEYLISNRNIHRLKAYYAARAGIDVGLLRVLLYQKALAAVGDKIGDQKDLLNMIWQSPLAWPPPLSDDASAIAKDALNKALKDSIFTNSYMVTIESEDSKIDINALGSKSEALVESTKKQILQIFQNKLEKDTQFYEKYRDTDFEELVSRMIDWVDEDQKSLTGSSENSGYDNLDADFVPPNQPFKTIQELKMVKGMNIDFFNILSKRVTVYGSQGVNINLASKEVILSLDPNMTEEAADELIKHRQSSDPEKGPFKKMEDLNDFLSYYGISDFNKDGIPIFFEEQFNFRIKSMGQSSNMMREIEVVTYDFEGLKNGLIESLKKEDEKNKNQSPDDTDPPPTDPNEDDNKGGSSDGSSGQSKKSETKKKREYKGRPQIVYWWEN